MHCMMCSALRCSMIYWYTRDYVSSALSLWEGVSQNRAILRPPNRLRHSVDVTLFVSDIPEISNIQIPGVPDIGSMWIWGHMVSYGVMGACSALHNGYVSNKYATRPWDAHAAHSLCTLCIIAYHYIPVWRYYIPYLGGADPGSQIMCSEIPTIRYPGMGDPIQRVPHDVLWIHMM